METIVRWIDRAARVPAISWLFHALFALPIVFGALSLALVLARLGLSAREVLAVSVTAAAFSAREVEQYMFARLVGPPTLGEMADRVMDVVVPAVVMGLVF